MLLERNYTIHLSDHPAYKTTKTRSQNKKLITRTSNPYAVTHPKYIKAFPLYSRFVVCTLLLLLLRNSQRHICRMILH